MTTDDLNRKIVLRVPGTDVRYGTFVCDLPFDNFVRLHITAFEEKGKIKQLDANKQFWYLGRREWVEFL